MNIPSRAIFCLMMFAVLSSCLASSQESKVRRQGAEILWDTWGVPHIYADDEASAFRAFGWAQMHNHANLVLQLIAAGRGRGAEFYGEDLLVSDRAVRTFGLYSLAGRWFKQQSPQFHNDIDAFAAGMNQFAREHPEKLDAAAKAVLPVDGVDIIAHATRVLQEFVRGASRCSAALPDHSLFGSNAWAIAPSHSAENRAMLLANPHLPWGDEFIFFEAQISVPGYEAYGATLLGFPVLAIAFNENLAWTHTVNTIDACDVYALTPRDGGYVYDQKVRPFQVEKQTIKVKQKDGSLKDESLELRTSIQGPVIERGGKFFAIRLAGLQVGSFAGALQEWWDMGRARDLAQFQAAIQRLQIPMFNVIYADRKGHIELLFGGQVPDRSTGDAAFWHGAIPGDKSTLVWNKLLSYRDLPKAIDPPAGWVQNSNSAPWYMTEPFLDPGKYEASVSSSPTSPAGKLSFREQRSMRMITRSAKLSFDQLLSDKYSTHSELADRVLDQLVTAARQSGDPNAEKAAAVLEKWDRETNADSKGAVLFGRWYSHSNENGDGLFSQPFDLQHPLETPRGLKDPKAAVAALIAAASDLQKSGASLDISWGEVNRLQRGKFDFPGNGGPDELGIFRVINYKPENTAHFVSMGGDSFIAAVEFASPLRARVLLTYGNSTDPASAHFGDQLELSSRKEWRTPWLTRGEVEHHLEERTTLP